MSKPYCPVCAKEYPSGDRAGHCAVCHETFIGLAAFDAHRTGPYGVPGGRKCQLREYRSVGPTGKPRYGHWQDERGYWHLGKQLTNAEKDQIFNTRSTQ